MLEHFRKIGFAHNMVLVIKRSWSIEHNRPGGVLFACEQYGKYRKKGADIRSTQTKLMDCKFALYGREDPLGVWKMYVEHGTHNHQLPKCLKGHAYAGRLNTEEVDMSQILQEIGTRPKSIGYGLRQWNKQNVSSSRTLTNTLSKLAVQERGHRTMTQHALYKLRRHGYYFQYNTQPADPTTLTNLFLAHPDGLRLLNKFPYVIVLDCTYKTNA